MRQNAVRGERLEGGVMMRAKNKKTERRTLHKTIRNPRSVTKDRLKMNLKSR